MVISIASSGSTISEVVSLSLVAVLSVLDVSIESESISLEEEGV